MIEKRPDGASSSTPGRADHRFSATLRCAPKDQPPMSPNGSKEGADVPDQHSPGELYRQAVRGTAKFQKRTTFDVWFDSAIESRGS
jgi:hypothetical protein